MQQFNGNARGFAGQKDYFKAGNNIFKVATIVLKSAIPLSAAH
jgi:hypothetical protein